MTKIDRDDAGFPTRCASGLPIFAIGIAAVIGGLDQRNPALLALGCVFFSTPAIIYVLLRRSSRHLDYARSAPLSAFEGDAVQVEMTLTNGSDQSLFFPQVSEVFSPEIHARKKMAFSGRLAPNEAASQGYTGHCILPRGVYSLGPTAIRLTDPLGWFEVRCRADAKQSFKVYPQVLKFGSDEQLGRCVSWIANEHTTRGVGESSEFHTVREYRTGDSRRRIHWGLTARLGRPVVREFARTAVGDLTVLLDSSRDALVGWGRSSSVEYSIKVALAVASETLGRGYRVRFVYGTDDDTRSLEASTVGEFQVLLDAMVEFRPTEPLRPLAEIAEQLEISEGGGAARGTIVVMVHPYLFGDLEFEAKLERWVTRRSRVLVVLFEGPGFASHRMNSTGGTRRAEISAVQYATHLESFGAATFIITCGDSLDTVFPEARRTREEARSRRLPAAETPAEPPRGEAS